MPKKRVIALPPLDYGNETVAERLARLRKERGFTQVELARKIGIIQTLISDYELDKLGLSADMAVRFSLVLNVTTDELLYPRKRKGARKPRLKVVRRMEEIEKLAPRQQAHVLGALDSILRGTANASR